MGSQGGQPGVAQPEAAPQPFFGRDRELGELRTGLADALSGHGRLFIVTGDAGIGKTSLAEALSAEAEGRGVSVLWGGCWEGGGAPAYWPWVQVIRSYVRGMEAEALRSLAGWAAPHIAQIVPEVREQLPDLPAPASLESEEARFALFDSVTSFVRNAGGAGPLLLVFDDLHAADRSSLLLLEFLAGALHDAHVLIVGTYKEVEARRTPEVGRLLAQVSRHGRVIPLRGLGETELGLLIEERAGTPPGEPLVGAVYQATEGNPFFTDELIRLLVAETAGGLPQRPEPGQLPLPAGVREVIRRRLDPLGADTAEVLTVASVLGREFALPTLEQVCSAPRERLLDALDEALSAGIVEQASGTLARYAFDHALIRETLYEQLPPARRARLHRDVSEALERLYESDPEPHLAELAYHFLEAAPAGEPAKAVDYAQRAGERAMRLLAYEEAAAHFERALEALELCGPRDAEQRCELVLALATAERRAGDVPKAKETFQHAAELARNLRMPDRLARAALGYGGLWIESGITDIPLLGLLEEALASLPEQDSRLRSRLQGRLAMELYWVGREAAERRGSLSAAAVEMARRLGDPGTLAYALIARHYAVWSPSNLDERLALAGESERVAQQTREGELAAQSTVLRIADLLELGDIAGLDAELERSIRLAEELRQPSYRYYAGLFRAMRALLEGRLEEAEGLANDALAIGQRLRAETALQWFGVQLLTLRREQGRLGELEDGAKGFADQYPAILAWRGAVALLECEIGNLDEARRQLEQMTSGDLADVPLDSTWAICMACAAEASAALGDARRAASVYELLLPYADRVIVGGTAAACFGSASRHLGLVATAIGRFDEAARHFDAALEANARLGGRPLVARTQHDYAAMLLARGAPGDRERAGALLADSVATAEQLGMTSLRSRAEALTERAGLSGFLPETPVEAAPSRPPAGPGATARAVLHREGEYWTLSYDGEEFRLRDAKGLRYLRTLLAHPEAEFHATDLVAGARPAPGSGREASELEVRPDLGHAGELLDPQAKAAYKGRLEDLREALEEAERFGDTERAARSREEMELLTDELARAVGLGGRDRVAASASERARVNATRAIKGAIRKIAEHDPALGRYLSATVRTGTFCAYVPDPTQPVSWSL